MNQDQKYHYSQQAVPIRVFGELFLSPKFAGHQHQIAEVARTEDPRKIKVYTDEGLLCEAKRVRGDNL